MKGTWEPDPDTGITGTAYVTEQLEAFVDDLSAAHTPGVYAIKCSQPVGFERVARRFNDKYDKPAPDWLMEAWACDAALYVGGADNIYERLEQHAEKEQTAAFLEIFPAHSIYEIWPCEDTEEAFQRESEIAIELQNKLRMVYVHQR